MPRIDISVSPELHESVRQACIDFGFDSISSYGRFALQNQLANTTGMAQLEAHIGKSMEVMRRDTQVLHAALDALVKLILLTLPEPPAELGSILRRDAARRHERFVKNVGYMLSGKRAPRWAADNELLNEATAETSDEDSQDEDSEEEGNDLEA